jgi:hypothetical protein
VELAVEHIDLQALTQQLRQMLGARLDASYLRGRTIVRDAIASRLACSAYEAEGLVETLELQGFIRFPHNQDETHSLERLGWRIG